MTVPDQPSDHATQDTQAVIDFWNIDRSTLVGVHWLDVPQVAVNFHRRATDDPSGIDWISHTERFFADVPRPRRALSLGCGFGIIERMVRQRDICQDIDGLDLADEAIQEAEHRAKSEGLTGLRYEVADLHTVELPAETYDVVYAHSCLHHVFHLERLLDQVHQTLKPNGVFIVVEYTGPAQMQYPRTHLELADALLQLIPPRYRRFVQREGVKDGAPRVNVASMNATDPSEAIRSREIVPLVATRFVIEHLRHLGGTLLTLVLNEIAGNFSADDPDAARITNSLITIENVLLDAGALPSYHTYLVARKTADPLPLLASTDASLAFL